MWLQAESSWTVKLKYKKRLLRNGKLQIIRQSFNRSELWKYIISRSRLNGECLEWTGHKSPKGYGVIGWRGKVYRVHRLAFQLRVGSVGNKEICHKCDNPACFEPRHLFRGTHLQNMRDAKEKGRLKTKRGNDHPQSKLDDNSVKLIRRSWNGEKPHAQHRLAKRFNVTVGAIGFILARKTWTHI